MTPTLPGTRVRGVLLRAGAALLLFTAWGITNLEIIYVSQSVGAGLLLGLVTGVLLLMPYVVVTGIATRRSVPRKLGLAIAFGWCIALGVVAAARIQVAPGAPSGLSGIGLTVDAVVALPVLAGLAALDGWFGRRRAA